MDAQVGFADEKDAGDPLGLEAVKMGLKDSGSGRGCSCEEGPLDCGRIIQQGKGAARKFEEEVCAKCLSHDAFKNNTYRGSCPACRSFCLCGRRVLCFFVQGGCVMAGERRVGMVILVCVLGALGGVVFGRLLVVLLPGLDVVFRPGIDLGFDIHVLRAGIRFNIAAVLGIVAALLVWRRL